MPNPNDLPADSAVSQLTIDLCRELYDRFAMGGWMPQDAHEQTEAMIRQRFDTPAAAAGPRQCEHKGKFGERCLDCSARYYNDEWHSSGKVPDDAPVPHAIVIHKIPHCVCGHAHDAGNICSRCACRVAKLCNCALAAAPVQRPIPHVPRKVRRYVCPGCCCKRNIRCLNCGHCLVCCEQIYGRERSSQ